MRALQVDRASTPRRVSSPTLSPPTAAAFCRSRRGPLRHGDPPRLPRNGSGARRSGAPSPSRRRGWVTPPAAPDLIYGPPMGALMGVTCRRERGSRAEENLHTLQRVQSTRRRTVNAPCRSSGAFFGGRGVASPPMALSGASRASEEEANWGRGWWGRGSGGRGRGGGTGR